VVGGADVVGAVVGAVVGGTGGALDGTVTDDPGAVDGAEVVCVKVLCVDVLDGAADVAEAVVSADDPALSHADPSEVTSAMATIRHGPLVRRARATVVITCTE